MTVPHSDEQKKNNTGDVVWKEMKRKSEFLIWEGRRR